MFWEWWAGDAVAATEQGWAGPAGMAPKRGWTQKTVSKWSCGKGCNRLIPDQEFPLRLETKGCV